jgi:hypothetical protein
MFGRKNDTVAPLSVSENVLIQISAPTEITKKTKVCVPMYYRAIAFIDEKPLFRIEPCANKDLVKAYGNELLGKQLRVAFVADRPLAQSAWGFGNVQVRNEACREIYRIGVNGKFSVEILDYVKLIQGFVGSETIDVEQIREKSISTLKSVGAPILGAYFSQTETSVLEVNSLTADFRDRLLAALQSEPLFAAMGIRISDLTVSGFCVDEEDLERIRQEIRVRGEDHA